MEREKSSGRCVETNEAVGTAYQHKWVLSYIKNMSTYSLSHMIKMYEYLIGKRIKLIHMGNDPSFGKTLNRGDLGTVKDVNTVDTLLEPFTQVWVEFDNGSFIALLMGVDTFEVIN